MRTNRWLPTVWIVVLLVAPPCIGCGAKRDAAPPPAPAAAAPKTESRMAKPSESAAPSGKVFFYRNEEASAPADAMDADTSARESEGPMLIGPGSGGAAVDRDKAAASVESAAREAKKQAASKVMMRKAMPKAAAPKKVASEPSDTSSQMVRTLPAPPAKASLTAPPKPLTETASADGGYQIVKVYYGTDRAASEAGAADDAAGWRRWTAIAAGTTIVLLLTVCIRRRGRFLKGLAMTGVVATLALGTGALLLSIQTPGQGRPAHREYGNERGSLELGVCEVSIPKTHAMGELESPSIFRMEVQEDPEKHVVLLSVTPEANDAFYDDLRGCVAKSNKKEAFVFIHGYNVTFEKAARRTAQLAHDLKFDGAPIFYSWPSAGGLFSYAVDETNVAWTVPDLKQFLTDIARRSGATNVHLIAHSMGNRALTDALRMLSYETRENAKIFREVILTAPDIDAEIFRRDIVPAITKTAERVTLYASSNDEALAMSKQFHGYPRAGESGANIVVIPGIDTVDVSAIDTSLLGHSYYGDNSTVLADIIQVLKEAAPPERRVHLRLARLGALRYWIFERLGLQAPGPKSK